MNLRIIYLVGWLCFVGSFFVPATAQQMTSEDGEAVAVWTDPADTHLHLALDPVFQVLERRASARSPISYGDEFAEEQAEFLRRAWWALPAACGWFAFWVSVVWRPWLPVNTSHGGWRRRGMIITGGVLLANVPILGQMFYREATLYPGYFHLRAGAYLLVAAYLLVGSALLWRAGQRSRAAA